MSSDKNENALEPLPNGKKLTQNEQMELVRYLGQYHTVAQAKVFMKKSFGKELAYMTIRGYLETEKWQLLIGRFREEFIRGYMEVPIANKRVRLEYLEGLLRKALAAGKDALAVRILGATQKEVESPNWTPPEPPGRYSDMSDEDLTAEILKTQQALQRSRQSKGITQDGKPLTGP